MLKGFSRLHVFCIVCTIFVVVAVLYLSNDSIPMHTFKKSDVNNIHNNVIHNGDGADSPNMHSYMHSYNRINALIQRNRNELEDDPKLLAKNGYNYHKSGYGIVFAATLDTLPYIYVSISILNYLNFTRYPIEIYLNEHDGKNEKDIMSKCSKYFNNDIFVDRMSIKCKFCHHHPMSMASYKSLYLLDTSFQHALYLDSKNMVIQTPQILFDSDEYNENHAIFWPNKCKEATQIVIDTIFYHNMLNLVIDCEDSMKYSYQDCFKLMWLQRNQSFYSVDIQPQQIGYIKNQSFYQHSSLQFWLNDRTMCSKGKKNNNPMFIHQTKTKLEDEITGGDGLWEYYREITNIQQLSCPMTNDQEYRYKMDKIKDNKINADLILELESKFFQFTNESKQF